MASLLGSAGGSREFVLKIIADVKDAVDGVSKVQDSTKSFKDKALSVGKAVAGGLAVGAVVSFGKASIQAAAEADDAMDAVNAAFGNSAKEIEQFSKGSADAMGMSAASYQMMAAKTGNLLQSMGINAQDAVKQTEVLTQRGADMATIWGTSTPEAMDAINAAMKGATKGLTKFGVVVSKNEIDARALKEGYVDASGKVTTAGRAIAAQEVILEKTSNVQGAFAANSKDLGSQQDIMRAKMENLQATIGTQLLPVILKIMEVIQPLVTFLSEHADILVPIVGGIMALVAALKVWNTVQLILNTTLLTNPIFLVAAAIAALVAGVIWAYQNVDWFRNAVDAMGRAVVATFVWIKDTAISVFNWLKDNWPLIVAILTGPFGTAVYLIVKYWDNIKDAASAAWHWIVDLFKGLGPAIGAALGNVARFLTKPFTDAWGTLKGMPDELFGVWKGFVDKFSWIMGGIGSAISTPFKMGFEAIKWAWNHTLGGFEFKIPDIFGIPGRGQTVKFPYMAKGGIVTAPMLAVVGDVPEAIVPLSRAAEFGMTGEGSQPSNVNINVYALTATGEVGRIVFNALREYERTSGQRLFIGTPVPSGF